MHPLRLALRRLHKTPAFALSVVATIAICLGANLAIFAVLDAILLRPLPFPEPGRLVTMFNAYPNAGVERDGASLTNYYERRGQLPALASLSIYRAGTAVVGAAGATRQEQILRVSPDFFTTLGVSPALGRGFNELETITPVAQHAVLLTDPYWRQHFDADPQVLGRDIRVNGAPRRIVGVLPAGFRFLSSKARLVLPLTSTLEQRAPQYRHAGDAGTSLIGRLQPGATIAGAQAQLDAHNTAVERDDPRAKQMKEAGFRSTIVALHADHVREIRPVLWLMQGGALFLLLTGVVNLTNLLLMRANGQHQEVAVRRALGANRRQVVQQTVLETLLLAVLGGLLGLLVGAAGIRLLAALGAERLPLGAALAFDGGLALMGLAGAVVLGLLLALPIAWSRLRSHPETALRSDSRTGTATRSALRLRHGFIVVQIALAFVLLAGAALLALSLQRILAVPRGFAAAQVVTGQFVLPITPFPLGSTQRVAALERLLAAIGQQPGVEAAGTITNIPLSGDEDKAVFVPAGQVAAAGESLQAHYAYGVAGDYFAALGIALREGRFLSSSDSLRADRVCVVDEEFARRYWPDGSALGQRVVQGPGSAAGALPFTIVGVVGAVKQASLTETQELGAIYVPYRFRELGNVFVVTRTRQSAEGFAETLRNTVHSVEPELSIDNIQTMTTRIQQSLVGHRSPALLAGLIAGVALLLASIGTYGVLGYNIAQRRREIGIRIALGAQRRQVRSQFLALGLKLLAAGIALGMIGAWITGQAVQDLLFGVPALHVGTLAGTTLVITLVSLLACFIPARRAARVDPMRVLAAD